MKASLTRYALGSSSMHLFFEANFDAIEKIFHTGNHSQTLPVWNNEPSFSMAVVADFFCRSKTNISIISETSTVLKKVQEFTSHIFQHNKKTNKK